MSLDKAITHGKEKRRQYYGSKSYDRTCRNHGSDDYARNNRLYQRKKEEYRIRDRLKDLDEDL